MEIKLRLREMRKTKGYTQERMAKELGVSHAAVQKWENGTCYPYLPHLIALTEIFDCTVEDLIERS